MNVRMTIDIPTQFLPRLENSLQRAGLKIEPYIKGGLQRWQLAPRGASDKPSIPDTIIAASANEVA